MPWHAKPEPTAPDPCDGCDNQCCVGECEHDACLADQTRPDWQPFEWTCDGCPEPQPEVVDWPAVEVDGKTYCDECVKATFKAILEHVIAIESPTETSGWWVTGKRIDCEDEDIVRAVRAVTPPKEGTDAD